MFSYALIHFDEEQFNLEVVEISNDYNEIKKAWENDVIDTMFYIAEDISTFDDVREIANDDCDDLSVELNEDEMSCKISDDGMITIIKVVEAPIR